MKKRIAYILHGLASGGTEAFVMNLAKELDSDVYDITFFLAVDDNGKTKQFREDEAIKLGFKIYRTCDLNNIFKILKHFFKLKKLLKTTGPYGIVHANMDLFNGVNLFAAKIVGVEKRICHSHNSQSQYESKNGKKVLTKIYGIIMRKLIKHNSTIMLGCSELANKYLYGDDWECDERCHVVYNGVRIKQFNEVNINPRGYLANCGIKQKKLQLITIGRLENQKNPHFIVEILYEMKLFKMDFHFTWVGSGGQKQQIEDIIKKYGLESYVTFLGVRKDIPELLYCHNCFLLPSLFEGLPIVLIEAQAAGLCCFVSDKITKEVDIGLCEYYSLDIGAKVWAEKIHVKMSDFKKEENKDLRLNKFDVQKMVKNIECYY